MKTKLLSLMALLVLCVTGAWAQTQLVSVDFSTWDAGNLANGTKKDGVQINSNGSNMSITTVNEVKYLNMGANKQYNRCVAIPLSNINGKINVTLTCGPDKDGKSNGNITYCYAFYGNTSTIKTDGNGTGFDTTGKNASSISIEIETEYSTGVLYIGRSGSNYIYLKGITVTTPSSCTDVAAPTSLTCSAQTSTSLTYTWTAAANASAYTAALYDNSACTGDPVATTSSITTNTVTFSGLSASTTYYCKVQSNGDGSTYCSEGGVTSAVSGTTSAKAYTVTAASNNNDWGSAASSASSLDEGETATITASAEDGYKFLSWAVSGTGASLSSTTTNPTTLTIGTSDATVTATFRALETYTITYDAGANGTGSIDAGEKTEDVAFTLSSSTFTRDGYVQTGWSLTDGGEKAYELGGSYETNAAQTFYPYWTAAYTLTYDANGGTGTMADSKGVGSITLTANTYTKSGYTFIGWATSQANADAGTVAYADKASYTLSENTTLYAVWAEIAYTFVPTGTSGETVTVDDEVSGSTGGTMVVTQGTLTYGTGTIEFSYVDKTNSQVKVTLNKIMQPGTVIQATLSTANDTERGLRLKTSSGTQKADWYEASASVRNYSYTVVAGDGLAGSNIFLLERHNNINLDKLVVANCLTPYAVTHTLTNVTATSGATGSVAAAAGTDYTAVFSASTGYVLPDDITVTIGGETATENTDYTWDVYTGTVTIAGASITGAIVITVAGEAVPTSGLLFSMEVDNVSSAYSTPAKTEVDLADYATITGGKALLGNKNNEGGKSGLNENVPALYFNGSDGYIKLTLRCPLKENDLIVFENGSGTEQICFTKTNSRSTDYQTTNNVYTCAATFEGTSTLYIWRVSSMTYVQSLKIYRNAAVVNIAAGCTDGENFYATYSNGSAFVVPEDLTVSAIKLNDSKKMTMMNYAAEDVVPADEGVLLTAAKAGNHVVYLSDAAGTAKDGNLLVGTGNSAVEASAMSDTDYYYYRLTMVDDTPGFWWKSDDGAGFALAANKAYLKVAKDLEVRGFSLIDEGETTGVVSVGKPQTAGNREVYNLAGQRVAQPAKGLYIVNGKKVIIK